MLSLLHCSGLELNLRAIFLRYASIYCEKQAELLEVKFTKHGAPQSMRFFNSQSCPHRVSSNLLIIVQVSHWSLIPADVAAPACCDSMYPLICFSKTGEQWLPCDFISLKNLRFVHFSISLAFYSWKHFTHKKQLHAELENLSLVLVP